MGFDNYVKVEFKNKSSNEGFARVVVAAFASQLDPTVEQLADIKTAVSEAVTNAIVHGYADRPGNVLMECTMQGKVVTITVADSGRGIDDVEQARQPLYTTNADDERSGMGFTVMEMFMDTVEVTSEVGKGTRVVMTKDLGKQEEEE